MFIATWIIAICSVFCCLSILFHVLGIGTAASLVNSIASNLFVSSFLVIIYCFFIMLIKTKQLGTVERKWKILSKVVAIMGCIGMIGALVIGILNDAIFGDSPILENITSIFLVIGIIAICCSIPTLIYTVKWLKKMKYQESPALNVLWKGNWIVIATLSYLLICLIVVFLIVYAFPVALFDVLSLRIWITQCQFILCEGLYVLFIVITHPAGRKRGSNSGSSNQRTTPQTPSVSKDQSVGQNGIITPTNTKASSSDTVAMDVKVSIESVDNASNAEMSGTSKTEELSEKKDKTGEIDKSVKII